MTFDPRNTLIIPDAMVSVTTIIGSVSAAFIPILFVIEVLKEQAKIITGEKPEYTKLVFRTFLVVLSLSFLYRWIFLKIVSANEVIALSIVNAGDWGKFVGDITTNTNGEVSITNLSAVNFFSAFFSVLITVAETVFLTVRYIFLSLLYIIGPMAFALNISSALRSFLKSWFVSLIQVSFWVVMLKVAQLTLLAMNLTSASYGGDAVLAPVVNGAIVCAMIFMIPALTSAFLSGGNLGLMGSAAIGAVTSFAMKHGGASVSLGSTAAGGAAAGAADGGGVKGALKGAFSSVVADTKAGASYLKAHNFINKRKTAASEPSAEHEKTDRRSSELPKEGSK